jgi:hypothetical protein
VPLSADEQRQYDDCPVQFFEEAAEDVRVIHNKALFRVHKTFESTSAAVGAGHGARAYQLIHAAVVAESLSTRVYMPQPKNERQVRWLTGFSPDEQLLLWSDAVEQVELLSAIVDRHTRPLADVLIVSARVGILETTPPADVIHENAGKRRQTAFDVLDHLRQRIATLDIQAAFSLIGVFLHNVEAAAFGVSSDHVHLVRGGVLLVLGRHADVDRSRVRHSFWTLFRHLTS